MDRTGGRHRRNANEPADRGDGRSTKSERRPIETSNYPSIPVRVSEGAPPKSPPKLRRREKVKNMRADINKKEEDGGGTSDASSQLSNSPSASFQERAQRSRLPTAESHPGHHTRRTDRRPGTEASNADQSPVLDKGYYMSSALPVRKDSSGSIQRSPSVSTKSSGPVYTGRKEAPGPGPGHGKANVPRTDTMESGDSQDGGVPIALVDLSNAPKRSSTVGRQFSLSKKRNSTRSERPLSFYLNRNSQIGRSGSRRSSGTNNDGSGSSAHRDPSLSTVSSSSTVDDDPKSRKALVSGWAEKIKGKEVSAKEKVERSERRQQMKERVKKSLKKASEIALPLIRDTLENTAQYGRMLGYLASYIAPAALMLIFLWDAVQFVDTMKDTMDSLVDRAVKQHESLTEAISTSVELLKASVQMKQGDPFTTANYDQIASILREHKDVCQSAFDKVLKTKRLNYLTLFIRRKKINDIDVAGAKTALDDALAKVNTTAQIRIYANSMNLLNRMDQVANEMGLQRNEIGTVRVEINKMMGEVRAIRGLPKTRVSKASSGSDEEFSRKELEKLGREELEEFRRAEIKEVERMIGAIDEALRDSNSSPIETGEDETVLNGLTNVRKDIERLEKQKQQNGWNSEKDHELKILQRKKVFYEKLLELERRATRAPTEDKGTQTANFEEQSTSTLRRPGDGAEHYSKPADTSSGHTLHGAKDRSRGGHPRNEEARHGRNSDRTATEGSGRDRNPMTDVPVSEDSPIAQGNLEGLSESSIYGTYESQLVRPFDAALRHVLWTPSPVRIGCVGYITKDGEFKILFEPDKMANKPEFSSIYSSFPRLNDAEGIDKTNRVKRAIGQSRESLNRRTSILSRGKPTGIIDLQNKIGRKIQARVTLPNVNSSKVAHLVLDPDCRYHRYDEADIKLLKDWFSQHIDRIHRCCDEGVAKEEIILVVGTLFAKNWAMLLATAKIRRQLEFYELEPTRQPGEKRRSRSSDISQPWGVYSIQHWRGYKENINYTTKVSQSNPGRGEGKWDTVLLAGIQITKDSNGKEVCISDYDSHSSRRKHKNNR